MVMAYKVLTAWGRAAPIKQRPQTPPLKKVISWFPILPGKVGAHEE